MIAKVETFIKIDDVFRTVRDCSDKIPDVDYIEGAICLMISDRSILNEKHWDLVDQLWSYLVEALENLSQNMIYQSTFPDQPLVLKMEPISKYCARITVGEQSYDVNREVLVNILVEGGREFYTVMLTLCPELKKTWRLYLARLNNLGKGL